MVNRILLAIGSGAFCVLFGAMTIETLLLNREKLSVVGWAYIAFLVVAWIGVNKFWWSMNDD